MQQRAYSLRDMQTGVVHLISSRGVRIGRIPENDVVISSGKVSRYHAVLWVQNGSVYIRDEQSTNGTRMNGEVICQPTRVPLGSHVQIADATFEVVAQVPGVDLEPLAFEAEPLALRRMTLGRWVPFIIAGVTGIVAIMGLFLGRAQQHAATTPIVTSQNLEAQTLLTLTMTPMATGTPKSTETATPSPSPSTTPTANSSLDAAPQLQSPETGYVHNQKSGPNLQWSSKGLLNEPYAYRIVMDYSHDNGYWREIGWSQQESWQVPEYVGWLISEPWECEWYVGIVKVEARDADGKPNEVTVVSDHSEVGMFTWPQS